MRHVFWLTTAALLLSSTPGLRAATPPDFDKDIKPILDRHCFSCHGPEKQRAGLRLDVKTSAFKGGDSGEPAVVPGSIPKSHLIKLITAPDPKEAMPPKGERLKPEEVALLQKWIETGAHWIEANQPVIEVPLESVSEAPAITEKDRAFWSFVPPKKSDAPATRNANWGRTKTDAFILKRLEEKKLTPSTEAPRAALIRRLTFDLTGLPPTPAEVDAFLADTSPDAYDRVVERLLASPRFGEKLASLWLPLARYAEDQAHQVGTDTKFFYPYAYKYREWVIDAFNRDLPYDQFLLKQIAADKADGPQSPDLAALGFLGLGPKYYNRNRLEVMSDEWEDRVDTVTRTTMGLTVACARCHDHKFDPISAHDYHALAGVFASTKMVNRTPDGQVQKGDLQGDKMHPGTLHVVEDEVNAQNLNLFIRGNVQRKGPPVPRRFLAVLSSSTPAPFSNGSGRLELAQAIASRENPLTPRVIVNRVWGMLLGTPLVATPSNFGRSGQSPSHPELLDDLAVRFMENNWSIKWLVREIVTSSTYRQSSTGNWQLTTGNSSFDPANESYWRANRRRLTIEQWRDSVLFVSNTLDPVGGKSLELTDEKNFKRTVYARISRLQLNDLLMQFDYPDANVHAEKRSVTSTPAQKLFVLNSPFMIGQAKAFAARVAAEAPSYDQGRIAHAFRLLYSRVPTPHEMKLSMEFLKTAEMTNLTPWEQFAQILLASNEAFYVD